MNTFKTAFLSKSIWKVSQKTMHLNKWTRKNKVDTNLNFWPASIKTENLCNSMTPFFYSCFLQFFSKKKKKNEYDNWDSFNFCFIGLKNSIFENLKTFFFHATFFPPIIELLRKLSTCLGANKWNSFFSIACKTIFTSTMLLVL